MKTKVLFPFVLFALLVLAVGLACSINLGTTATSAPPAQPQQQPTQPPAPTAVPTQPPPPTMVVPTATEETPAFFWEDFTGDLGNWSYITYGSEDNNTISAEDGKIIFNITEADAGIMFLYDPYVYTDVRIDVALENKGRNTINVTLLCRYSDSDGFYQAVVTSDGRYVLNAYDAKQDSHTQLYDGASADINQGKASNIFGMKCEGNTVTLYVNDVEVRSVEDKYVVLDEGQVGVYVGAIGDIVPVIVELDEFLISQP